MTANLKNIPNPRDAGALATSANPMNTVPMSAQIIPTMNPITAPRTASILASEKTPIFFSSCIHSPRVWYAETYLRVRQRLRLRQRLNWNRVGTTMNNRVTTGQLLPHMANPFHDDCNTFCRKNAQQIKRLLLLCIPVLLPL